MNKIFVIAGNKYQAEVWIKQDLEKRSKSGTTTLSRSEYVYVDDATRIRGIRDPHGVFIGTWKERWDIQEVVETLMIQSSNANAALGKIYKDLTPKYKGTGFKPTTVIIKNSGPRELFDTNPLPLEGRVAEIRTGLPEGVWLKKELAMKINGGAI